MKIAVLGYSNTNNIGDNIQTLAVAQHIGQECSIVDRDFLSHYAGEPCVVVMNGWFSHEPQNWPPSENIIPIFFGFHLSEKARETYSRHSEYLKRFEPIGCRDRDTVETLTKWGVDAYISGCATMTFPERPRSLKGRTDVLVDIRTWYFDRKERKQFRQISHKHDVPFATHATKNQLAKDLLTYYRTNARAAITSRIHCAIPCFALGIPAVYSGIIDYRTEIIADIGIPTTKFSRMRKTSRSSIQFGIPDFNDKKTDIANDLRGKLTAHGICLAPWSAQDTNEDQEFLSNLKWA
ncbi:hypothetical protein J2Z31_003648 [Sinorhizobium kostiense]|uniref:Polysaccharide pyruvyl transferase domain-containing protein n=1 Tax=Sinorhizobium kostiense TaxID=76747 RepID=A0ABS4R491_9HYPH|nr:polysaccharide pyruvyl transferase family protein [Sinorhizobium kostiense]MBP2237134.1 hypothetical protein [Sinorhizobium kostiense]